MTITFFSNYLNHHVVGMCDELYAIVGDDFHFVATCPSDPSLMKGGEDYSKTRPYCIKATDSEADSNLAYSLAVTSDVCRFGGDALKYAVARAKNNPNGLSFEAGERWLKKGIRNVFSPRLLEWWWYYQTLFRKSNFYFQCSSAYAARDLNLLAAYKDRCYKWGYFISVNPSDKKNTYNNNGKDECLKIMWCSRFIDWKHPEIPVLMARELKKQGYYFIVDMYGGGELFETTKKMAEKNGVDDVVNFKGSLPNNEIVEAMQNHDVFLLTSDRNEGWGVVVNEAMINGCVVVTCNEAGCAPYLIKEGKTGFMFDSGDIKGLAERMKFIIDNRNLLAEVKDKAYNQMVTMWNPHNAIMNFLTLIDDLQNGRESSIVEGPCSKA